MCSLVTSSLHSAVTSSRLSGFFNQMNLLEINTSCHSREECTAPGVVVSTFSQLTKEGVEAPVGGEILLRAVAEVPESHQVRGVAPLSQHLGQEGQAPGQAGRSEGADVAPLYSHLVGVEASQQGGSRGRTARLGVETVQRHPLLPQ